MADIQKAALWLQEGKPVRRSFMRKRGYFKTDEGGFIHWDDKDGADIGPLLVDMLCPSDLLATDWEIAE